MGFLFLFGGGRGETEEGTVVFEKFADQEDGIDGYDAIADQTSDVVGLGVALLFDKYVVPQLGELGIVLFELLEQLVLALADFLQRAVFTDGFLDGQHGS